MIVRSSKYRHVYAEANKADESYSDCKPLFAGDGKIKKKSKHHAFSLICLFFFLKRLQSQYSEMSVIVFLFFF